jgi:hypothetical protein
VFFNNLLKLKSDIFSHAAHLCSQSLQTGLTSFSRSVIEFEIFFNVLRVSRVALSVQFACNSGINFIKLLGAYLGA